MKKMNFKQLLQAKCLGEKRTFRKNGSFSHVPLRSRETISLRGLSSPRDNGLSSFEEQFSHKEKMTKLPQRNISFKKQNSECLTRKCKG
jgi:hypothetical protein